MNEPLTLAELRALQALAHHETTRDAASSLSITEQTVRNEASHAFRKLGVRNRTSAFRRLGWLRPIGGSHVLIGVREDAAEG